MDGSGETDVLQGGQKLILTLQVCIKESSLALPRNINNFNKKTFTVHSLKQYVQTNRVKH